MNEGLLHINYTVANSYMDVLSGKLIMRNDAQKIRSEILTLQPNDSQNAPEEVQKRICIIPIQGPITRQNLLNSNNQVAAWGMDYIAYQIDDCTNDPNCMSIILDMNTGGGYSNAVASVIESIQRFKASGREIYCSGDIVGSAGFHIASFCSAIIANSKSSLFGCIGTMWEGTNASAFDKRMGITTVTVVSDQTPNKNLEFKQAIAGNPALLKKNIINPVAQHFIDDVQNNLNITLNEATKGGTYAAEKAIELGLCHAIIPLSGIIDMISKGQKITKKEITPTAKRSLSKNKNMSKISLWGWFNSKNSGITSPEDDSAAMEEYARLQGLENTFTLEKTGLNSTIDSLQNSLKEKETALTDANAKIADLESRLAKTSGTPAVAPVSEEAVEVVPGMKTENALELTQSSADFNKEVERKRTLRKGY